MLAPLLWVQLVLYLPEQASQGTVCFCLCLSIPNSGQRKESLLDLSEGADKPLDKSWRSSAASTRRGSSQSGATLTFSPQEARPEDLGWHPASGGPALGAGPVPPARLGHLLLLHLEGGQVHGQGELFWLQGCSLWPPESTGPSTISPRRTERESREGRGLVRTASPR